MALYLLKGIPSFYSFKKTKKKSYSCNFYMIKSSYSRNRKRIMTVEEYNKSVDLYADGIYRFALKILKDQDKAKDTVQDTFEKLWIKHPEVSFEKVKSYLFTTVYHASIDLIRKEKKKDEYESSGIFETSSTEQYNDINEVLNKAVELLPEIQKSVLLLRDYEGYSYEEIGEMTGLNESQVKVYIFRARLFLKNYLVSIENLI